jgi:hypothetical protein
MSDEGRHTADGLYVHVLLVVVLSLDPRNSCYERGTEGPGGINGAAVNRQEEEMCHHDAHSYWEHSESASSHHRYVDCREYGVDCS